MKKQTLKSVLCCVLAAIMLAGCSSAPKNPGGDTSVSGSGAQPVQNASGGVFHDYITADIDTISPYSYTASASTDIFSKTTLELYRDYPSEDCTVFERVPELAESDPVQMDEEGKVWQVKLRENAKWENGDPINVDDVIYSFQMCLDPIQVNGKASQAASNYVTIAKATEYSLQGDANTVSWDEVGFKRIDDYVLGIELELPATASDIKAHFNTEWTSIVHKGTYEANMNSDRSKSTYGSNLDSYMSCGQFRLTEWIPGSVFKMEKNPDYVLSDKIKLDGYEYKVLGDSNTALELYLNGDLDQVKLTPDSIEQYIDDSGLKIGPSDTIQSLSVNLGNTNNNGILGNLNFRKALFYAIDRESISKLNNAIPAYWMVPSKCIGVTGEPYRETPGAADYLAENNGYDPTKAKEYFDKAMSECGLSQLTLTLMYSESNTYNKSAS